MTSKAKILYSDQLTEYLAKYLGLLDKIFALIDQSFLSEDYKVKYKKIWLGRSSRLK